MPKLESMEDPQALMEAVQAVTAALAPLTPDERARVLRTVHAFFRDTSAVLRVSAESRGTPEQRRRIAADLADGQRVLVGEDPR